MAMALPGMIEDIAPINAGLHENLVAIQQGLEYSIRVAADMLDMAARQSTWAAQDQRSAWMLHAKFPKERETALLRMPLLPGSTDELGEDRAFMFGDSFTSELQRTSEVKKQLQELKVTGAQPKDPSSFKSKKGYRIPKKKANLPKQRSVQYVSPAQDLQVTRRFPKPTRGGGRGGGRGGPKRGGYNKGKSTRGGYKPQV
jgi:hypothetical protein